MYKKRISCISVLVRVWVVAMPERAFAALLLLAGGRVDLAPRRDAAPEEARRRR